MNNKIRLFDSFAGVGALHLALKRLGVDVEVVGLSEIDIDAMIAYTGVHEFDYQSVELPSVEEMKEYLLERNIGYSFEKDKSTVNRMPRKKLEMAYRCAVATNNYGDISKIDYAKLPDFNLFNFSVPCTDLSSAGKQKGLKNADGSHTRSGLVKFGIDLIKTKKPKYVMIENVKALISKKFIDDFYSIVNEIESYGYKCYYPTKEVKGAKVPVCLNSKDFNIPQNRERIFVICVREDEGLNFEFPIGMPLQRALKDMLEDNVEDKYYINTEKTKSIIRKLEEMKEEIEARDSGIINIGELDQPGFKMNKQVCDIAGISPCVVCHTSSTPKILDRISVVGNLSPSGFRARDVLDTNGISKTVMDNHGCALNILESKNYYCPEGSNGNYSQGNRIYKTSGNAPTLTSSTAPSILEDKDYITKKYVSQ